MKEKEGRKSSCRKVKTVSLEKRRPIPRDPCNRRAVTHCLLLFSFDTVARTIFLLNITTWIFVFFFAWYLCIYASSSFLVFYECVDVLSSALDNGI
jgi:hypothetical protein